MDKDQDKKQILASRQPLSIAARTEGKDPQMVSPLTLESRQFVGGSPGGTMRESDWGLEGGGNWLLF